MNVILLVLSGFSMGFFVRSLINFYAARARSKKRRAIRAKLIQHINAELLDLADYANTGDPYLILTADNGHIRVTPPENFILN